MKKIYFSLLLVSLALLGMSVGLQFLKFQTDNRSSAVLSYRSGWLGLGVDWDQFQTAPAPVLQQIRGLGTPWTYDWKTEPNRYAWYGDSFTPMIWGCSDDAGFAATLNKAFSWPKSDYYLMFLNEPDDSHNLCTPDLAARRLHTLLTHPNKKPGLKVMVSGGINGAGWLSSMLQSYRSQFGANPNIQGIHVHIYAWPASGVSMENPPVGQLMDSGKWQLNHWRRFITNQEKWLANKEFWISETGLLSAVTPEPIVGEFMRQWLAYLDTQPFVNRVYWYINNVESERPFTWQFRSSALHRDMIPTTLAGIFRTECAKYCPRLTYPIPPIPTPLPTSTLIPIPKPTPTPSPVPTPTPTPRHSPTATPQPTATPKPSVSPTAVPTPTPTVVPTLPPSPTPVPPTKGDFNNDGVVNLFDYNQLLPRLNTTNASYNLVGTSATIDLFDYNELLKRM